MDLKRVEEIAYHQMGNRKEQKAREAGWLYYHGLRTAKIACQLCQTMGIEGDSDAIYVGALFHDIGKGTEPHGIRGAELARTLLANECDPRQLDTICQIIALHNRRHDSPKHPLFVRVVQDADLLDHVGPIGPWLSFYWSGVHGETMHDHVRFTLSEANHEYVTGMRNSLNFDLSREMFDRRARWADEVLTTVREVYFGGLLGEELNAKLGQLD